ncbi:DUF4097 family beta strand repeat-containing protein [Flavitalea flava]
MKKIKATLLCLVMACTTTLLQAQDFKIQADNSKEGKLTLDGFTGDLPVEGYSGNEILITCSSGNFRETPDRAKGLKPIFPGGNDNTGLGISMEKNGNQITLHCLLALTQHADYKIRVPENYSLVIKRECPKSGETTVLNMKNEVEFSGCHSIKLKNVTGPLVISTINGNVDVAFSELNKDKPVSITSVSGEIDVTVPARASFDLEMSTLSGNMYSDFEFPADNKQLKKVGGSSVRNQLNGGGADLRIHTISGSIYLRKG